jgi:formylmethanofuran dehydrogenase subunit E-like metal-binding protein
VVSIADGWANDFPEDLVQGALYHDHLCGGVSAGFLTVSYIKLSMRFQWDDVWKTAEKEFAGLGGLVIRYDEKAQKGDATLLKFNWRRDDLLKFINDPNFDLQQRGNSLLHVYFARFFLADKNHFEKFLCVMATKPINSQADLERRVAMGANPLEEMLNKRIQNEK